MGCSRSRAQFGGIACPGNCFCGGLIREAGKAEVLVEADAIEDGGGVAIAVDGGFPGADIGEVTESASCDAGQLGILWPGCGEGGAGEAPGIPGIGGLSWGGVFAGVFLFCWEEGDGEASLVLGGGDIGLQAVGELDWFLQGDGEEVEVSVGGMVWGREFQSGEE